MQKPIKKFRDGLLHCITGPAVDQNGIREWWVNGLRHRTDGPAVEQLNGTREWWVNGLRHRTDGPAIEYLDGTSMYWVDDKLHRLDGPAIDMHIVKSWWHNGNCLNTIYLTEKKKIPNEIYLKFGIR